MNKKNNIVNSIIIIILGLVWIYNGVFTTQNKTLQIIFIIGAIFMLIKGVLIFINIKKRKDKENNNDLTLS